MTGYAELWTQLARVILPAVRRYRASLVSLSVSEKRDGTLLTEADLAIQDLIVDVLLRNDPQAKIVAEESENNLTEADADGKVWIVDPIDGTSQFIDPRCTEFCSVVAVIERGEPTGCMILAPELGMGRAPVLITLAGDGQPPLLDGKPAAAAPRTRLVCATRSSRRPAAPVEAAARRQGLLPKIRGTSQTLDMARTTLDLEPATGLPSFRWFIAARQLLWDAAAGVALAKATGRVVVNALGDPVVPIEPSVMASPEPRISSTLVAKIDDIEWVIAHYPAT